MKTFIVFTLLLTQVTFAQTTEYHFPCYNKALEEAVKLEQALSGKITYGEYMGDQMYFFKVKLVPKGEYEVLMLRNSHAQKCEVMGIERTGN